MDLQRTALFEQSYNFDGDDSSLLLQRRVRHGLLLSCRSLFIYKHLLFGKCPKPDLAGLGLDLDVDAGRHFQAGKGLEELVSGLKDVDEPLVGPLLELLTGIFIFVDGAENGHNFLLGGKRNRTADGGAVLLDGIHDLGGGRVYKLMIIGFKGNSEYLICHKKSLLLFVLF